MTQAGGAGADAALRPACRGFPPALAQLKQRLSDTYGSLPRENPGSRWPKTSLAALRDDQRLSPEQLQRLISICK